MACRCFVCHKNFSTVDYYKTHIDSNAHKKNEIARVTVVGAGAFAEGACDAGEDGLGSGGLMIGAGAFDSDGDEEREPHGGNGGDASPDFGMGGGFTGDSHLREEGNDQGARASPRRAAGGNVGGLAAGTGAFDSGDEGDGDGMDGSDERGAGRGGAEAEPPDGGAPSGGNGEGHSGPGAAPEPLELVQHTSVEQQHVAPTEAMSDRVWTNNVIARVVGRLPHREGTELLRVLQDGRFDSRHLVFNSAPAAKDYLRGVGHKLEPGWEVKKADISADSVLFRVYGARYFSYERREPLLALGELLSVFHDMIDANGGWRPREDGELLREISSGSWYEKEHSEVQKVFAACKFATFAVGVMVSMDKTHVNDKGTSHATPVAISLSNLPDSVRKQKRAWKPVAYAPELAGLLNAVDDDPQHVGDDGADPDDAQPGLGEDAEADEEAAYGVAGAADTTPTDVTMRAAKAELLSFFLDDLFAEMMVASHRGAFQKLSPPPSPPPAPPRRRFRRAHHRRARHRRACHRCAAALTGDPKP